ncbi:nuclear RNA export factor 1-like [Schistocerca nitens]|uniref:nuclear RNA export factor 1-like n=1 Tax=Schistocerca nitens TaxID=7011 RepID=UPI00211985A4|nr:nuclear RNA export factor 1-like [Schistocerca nitens]
MGNKSERTRARAWAQKRSPVYKSNVQISSKDLQRPGTDVYIQPPRAQSECKADSKKEIRNSGKNIQKLASQTGRTPISHSSVPSQDLPAAVTSTSGGSDAPNEVFDHTNEVTEVESTNEMVEVDSTNAAQLLAARPHILSDTTPDIWHKVTVKPAVVDRVAVLHAINRRISPLRLIPYFFSMEDGHITFLVNNCNAPLTTLFKQNLKVPFHSIQIEMKVQLRAKKLSLSAILQRIIYKRLSCEKTVLDLSYLISIPEFQQVVYDPSETSQLQQQLMKMVQGMAPNLISLSLAGNGLTTLSHLATIFGDKTKWHSLKVLDVTDNKIKTICDLAIFNSVPITELYLHKNPVCGKYKEDHSYISVIRVIFPHLAKLDETFLHRIPGLPRWRPNYILCSSPGDSAELADQFVEHFFVLYDSADRTWLHGLYHVDAYFSLSSMYLPGQSTSLNARLSSYVAECRNLLHPTNKLRLKAALCHGSEKVLTKLEKLPQTQHDPYSFTVDLLHHSAISTVLTVTGVFRERNSKQNISPRHFMRTFVLVRLANNEYQIVNDIMYITNATTAEAEDAFRYMKPETNLKKIRPLMRLREGDENSMIEMYSHLTNMTTEWSHKCLVTAGWDLRRALQTFIEMYEADKIPAGRFIKPKKSAKF